MRPTKNDWIRVVVLSGPIASGKSTLGLAVGVELERRGGSAAVVDLDLVYEALDPARRPKDDPATWSEARRAAGRIAAALLVERDVVVLEGDFRSESKRAELEETVPQETRPVYVALRVDYPEALRRARADPTRGLSRDPATLAAHYETVEPPMSGDLVVDTAATSVSEAARTIVDRAAPDRCPNGR